MIANASNALLFLVSALFDLALFVFLTRILLQLVRADFYNPISQLIWKLTQPLIDPMSRMLPRFRRLDLASSLVALMIAFAEIEAITILFHVNIGLVSALWFSVLKILRMIMQFYTLTLFVQAILSWVGPGVSNPAANVLWSLNEPLLRPVRRMIPLVAGLDLSPIVVMILLQVLLRLLPLPGYFL